MQNILDIITLFEVQYSEIQANMLLCMHAAGDQKRISTLGMGLAVPENSQPSQHRKAYE